MLTWALQKWHTFTPQVWGMLDSMHACMSGSRTLLGVGALLATMYHLHSHPKQSSAAHSWGMACLWGMGSAKAWQKVVWRQGWQWAHLRAVSDDCIAGMMSQASQSPT